MKRLPAARHTDTVSDMPSNNPLDERHVIRLRRRPFDEAVRHIIGCPRDATDDDVLTELALLAMWWRLHGPET